MTHAQGPEPTADSIMQRHRERQVEREREINQGLQQRVRELEETVHYLYKTLEMRGLLNGAEASVGSRMYERNETIRRQTRAR